MCPVSARGSRILPKPAYLCPEMQKQGTVVKSIGNTYVVRDEAGVLHDCIVRGKFRIREGLKTTNPVAMGITCSLCLRRTATSPARFTN